MNRNSTSHDFLPKKEEKLEEQSKSQENKEPVTEEVEAKGNNILTDKHQLKRKQEHKKERDKELNK